MPNKWKNRVSPDIGHILALMGQSQLGAFVMGHLIIESVLVQLIDTKLSKPEKFDAFQVSFPRKVELCLAHGLFDAELASLLHEINTVRNKFAHRLGFKLSFSQLFALANHAAESGIDYSDETIYRNEKLSEERYGDQGILHETLTNTVMHLTFLLEDNGGSFRW